MKVNSTNSASSWRSVKVEQWRLDRIRPYPNNARTHSEDQISRVARSIKEFGFTNPILVDEAGVILAGHGRLLAARALGLERAPVIRLVGLSEAQRAAYRLADNKLAELAGWDGELLRLELGSLRDGGFELSLTGFSEDEIKDILGAAPTSSNDDAVPVPAARPKTKLGDLYELGAHRLLCGDATNPAHMARLLGKHRAALVVTDPPYNVDYEGVAGKIQNDAMPRQAFDLFLRRAFAVMYRALADGGAIYVAHSDAAGIEFRTAMLAAGFRLASCLIWKKNQFVLGHSDYHYQHEPILYAWKPTRRRRWFGGRTQTTIAQFGPPALFEQVGDDEWMITIGETALVVSGQKIRVREIRSTVIEEAKPVRSTLHPTMKPVALLERFVQNSSRRGDLVLDPFGGSGSTMIACEKHERGCLMMELDPKFCDVIVERWESYTSRKAARAR